MKVKQSPEDFVVEELTDVVPGDAGDFALYRLDKTGWATPDALAAIRRRWDIELRRMSYGGLKDRHARTTQFFSIFRGPRRDLSHHGVTVTHLGSVARQYTADDIRANRFAVTLRDLPRERRDATDARFAGLAALGVPNYFDDQRFGSVSGPGGEFIGRLLVKGRFEDALKLALAGPYAHDSAAAKAEKQTLLDHWGDWAACKDRLPRGHARSLVDYLRVHPGDFKGAVVRLRPELRGLYLSAYQSHLWNRMLAAWIEAHTTPETRGELVQRLGPVPFPLTLSDEAAREYAALRLPLPSVRWKPEEGDPRLPLVEAVLTEEGLTLREMQVRGVRDLFFSRGERPARVEVRDASRDWAEDERHPGRLRLTMRFELGRGSYATLVVKAVT